MQMQFKSKDQTKLDNRISRMAVKRLAAKDIVKGDAKFQRNYEREVGRIREELAKKERLAAKAAKSKAAKVAAKVAAVKLIVRTATAHQARRG